MALIEDGVVAADRQKQADGDHVGEYGGAAVGDERERQARDRHDADRHADVDERLEAEPDGYPRRHQHAEHVVGHRRDPMARKTMTVSSPTITAQPTKP